MEDYPFCVHVHIPPACAHEIDPCVCVGFQAELMPQRERSSAESHGTRHKRDHMIYRSSDHVIAVTQPQYRLVSSSALSRYLYAFDESQKKKKHMHADTHTRTHARTYRHTLPDTTRSFLERWPYALPVRTLPKCTNPLPLHTP